jgi:hypothetical protein
MSIAPSAANPIGDMGADEIGSDGHENKHRPTVGPHQQAAHVRGVPVSLP